jgi:hypothetical protein
MRPSGLILATFVTSCLVASCTGTGIDHAKSDYAATRSTTSVAGGGPAARSRVESEHPRAKAGHADTGLAVCFHRPIYLRTGGSLVRMQHGLGPMRAGSSLRGSILRMRVGQAATIFARSPCDVPGLLSLNPWDGGGLSSKRANTVVARTPGRTFVLADIPMCAQTDDPECLGGVAVVAYERVDVLPARHALTATSGTPRAMPLSAEHICHRVLHSAVVLAWAPGTVAQFRDYQYGGPQPTVPLADAFPGVPGGTRGAWCGTKAGRQATEWWAVIPGHPAAFAIGVSGPGEGVRTGAVSGPIQVP